tara:strand:- start:356 stop:616 length:261 start_codon:yes stop_codon:yes gene_type:complete
MNEFGIANFGSNIVKEIETDDLEKCRLLTQMMREHQQSVIRLGKQRRSVIRRLREKRVPYRLIADSCGVTDQALFADLRKHPEDKP